MTANHNLSGRTVQQQSYLFKYLSELRIHLCRARRITVLVTYPNSDLTTLNNDIQHTFGLLVVENFSKHFRQFERIDADRLFVKVQRGLGIVGCVLLHLFDNDIRVWSTGTEFLSDEAGTFRNFISFDISLHTKRRLH